MSDVPTMTITTPPQRLADPVLLLRDARDLVETARRRLDRAGAINPALPSVLAMLRHSLGSMELELEHVADLLARDCGETGCQLHHPPKAERPCDVHAGCLTFGPRHR